MDQDDESFYAVQIPAQPSPDRRLAFWAAIVLAVNILCVLMLAARASAPAEMRGYFDVALFAFIVGGTSFGIIRLMFLYPFRLMDLLVIVISLSIGMKFAIDAARVLLHSGWSWMAPIPDTNAPHTRDNSAYILYAEACMVTACVMMGGAALGLRHCRVLNITAPLNRALALICGLTSLPALAGLTTIPFHLLSNVLAEKEVTNGLSWVGSLIFSFVATIVNATLAIKTIALTTQNAAPEAKWRE